MKVVILSSLLVLSVPVFAQDKALVCLSTREFITTLEYLREHKEFSLEEEGARKLAHSVSQGCTGASKRFIQVSNLLLKVGVPSKTALETGLKFAPENDEAVKAFLHIFKTSYLQELLDLDIQSALKIALELSLSYDGERKISEKEFNRIAEFCVAKKSLDFPLSRCAHLASRVVKSGETFKFDIGKDFIELYDFLTSQEKGGLPSFTALDIAEHVVKYGPEGRENFFKAYEYALSNKGLELPIKDAIEFAKTMASRSVKK